MAAGSNSSRISVPVTIPPPPSRVIELLASRIQVRNNILHLICRFFIIQQQSKRIIAGMQLITDVL